MAASSVIPKASSGAMTAVSFAHCFLCVPNTSSRSKLVSDSQFENSGCDMQLFINTCLYASANCLGSGLAENPPFALIKLKQFQEGLGLIVLCINILHHKLTLHLPKSDHCANGQLPTCYARRCTPGTLYFETLEDICHQSQVLKRGTIVL